VIKAFMKLPNNRMLLLLGLSKTNIERLQAKQPIHFCGEGVGLPNLDVAIMFGETEQAMYDELKENGMVGEGTSIVSTCSNRH
jgi:hypothetical protein